MQEDKEVTIVGTSTSEKEKPISFFELVLAYSYNKDVFMMCQALNKDNHIQDTEIFKLLAQKQLLLAETMLNIVSPLVTKMREVALTLSEKKEEKPALIGDALALTSGIIHRASMFIKKLRNRLGDKNLFTDHVFSLQLFSHFYIKSKDEFLETIESAKSQRKIGEAQLVAIDDILINFQSDTDLINLTISDKNIIDLVTDMDTLRKTIAESYGLGVLYKAHRDFDECIKVNQTVARFLLSEEEIGHFSGLVREHMTETKSSSIVIIRMLFSLNKIRPIYTLELNNFIDLMDGSFINSKCDYIRSNFTTEGAQVYRTYEGLGLAANAYTETSEIIQKMITNPPMVKGRAGFIEQMEKYQECFINYFQLTMRFVMPLNEFIVGCTKIRDQLNNPISTLQGSELLIKLSSNCEQLKQCSEILRLKALSINALEDITRFIKELETLIRETKAVYFWQTDYKPLLIAILEYFKGISQSTRTEDFNNFQGILLEVDTKLREFGMKIDYEKIETGSDEEKLLLRIHKRYTENVEKHQKEDLHEKECRM